MPEKPQRRPTKAKAPARPKAARAKSAPKSKPAFYVVSPRAAVTLSNKKPVAAEQSESFTDFHEARSAAMDALIAGIEQAEQQLFRLRRSDSYESWRAQESDE